MPTKRTLKERGYKQILLNPRAAQAFEAYRRANGAMSASDAVLALLAEGVSIHHATADGGVSIHPDAPSFGPDDFERMCLACRVLDRRQMQAMREWFAAFFGWDD